MSEVKTEMAVSEDDDKGGTIITPFWETRKITEWEYRTPIPFDEKMVERYGQPKMSIALRRVDRMGEKERYEFVARCPWFSDKPSEQEITALTLSELEKKCKRALDDVVLAASGIKWEDWLEVEIRGELTHEEEFKTRRHRRDSERGANLSVSYKIMRRATLRDGRDMMLQGGWTMKPFPKPKKAGVDPDQRRRRGDYHYEYDGRSIDSEYAYIKATPENIAALDSIRTMIHGAGGRLQSFLAQGQIQSTLAKLPAVGLLEVKK